MIYLDNAATTFPKPKTVIKATEDCIKKYCANSGRSSHKLAVRTSEEIYLTREAVATYLNHDYPENVCFTTNATYALNIAIKSLIPKDSHVLISDIEHNSVLRPIHKMQKCGYLSYSIFSSDGNIEANIRSLLKDNTKAIVSTLMSNVTGYEIQAKILSSIAKEKNIILILDASQLIGHKKIDLKKCPCDALCAPAHKGLFGIQGAGFVIFSKNIYENTFIDGGSGNESQNFFMPQKLPEHFEAGTLPTPSIVALRAGIEFINEFKDGEINQKTENITQKFKERLESIKSIKLYGSENGIISFAFSNFSSSLVATELDKKGICLRGGLHCAPLAHRKLGTTENGLIRVSLSIFNKENEADILYNALRELEKKYL